MLIATISPRSTGKTTITAWLLHALHERGYPVKGFDADESEQLFRWWEARPEGSYPFEVEKEASTRFHERVPSKVPVGTVAAVDCGHLENHSGIGWSVLRVADLAIVACAATNSDVERMDEMPLDFYIDQVIKKREDKKRPETWVLLCRVQPGSTIAPKGIRNTLTEDGWNVFTTEIPAIQKYASTGEGVPIKASGSHFDELVTEMEQRGLIKK
ncbi:plasmid partition protein [Streptomyces murinus]|uniref:plasmid partition protein n=1 Tax=Streptomyces subrutilus TaxID=36818 RepID=UPI0033DE87D2